MLVLNKKFFMNEFFQLISTNRINKSYFYYQFSSSSSLLLNILENISLITTANRFDESVFPSIRSFVRSSRLSDRLPAYLSLTDYILYSLFSPAVVAVAAASAVSICSVVDYASMRKNESAINKRGTMN